MISEVIIALEVKGLPELAATLQGIVPKLRRRAIRNSLAAGARLVRDAGRENRRTSTAGSPLTGNEVRSYHRGTVAKAINVRTSKRDASAGDVGVYVNVRPLKQGAGRNNPDDPFYWRWLEFGTKFMAAQPFLTPAANRLVDALKVIEDTLGPQIQKLEKNPKDPL